MTDPEWERGVLREIEQMRAVLGVSRARCALSDDTVSIVFVITVLLTTLVSTANGWGLAGLVGALAVTVVTMWCVGFLFRT